MSRPLHPAYQASNIEVNWCVKLDHKVDPYASNGVSSLEACVKLCREDNRCVAADYYPNTTKQCHRKNGPRDSLSRMKSMKGAQAFYKIAYAGA